MSHSAPASTMFPRQKPLPPPPGNTRQVWIVCLLLVVIVWAVFGQTRKYDFINFDDGVYVYDNPLIMQGLTATGFATAFSCKDTDNWTPLTTLSHMLDCQLFGTHAGGHHLTNVLLHTAAVILLFLVLRRMTAALWPSAFVAAVFAIHPLHVESVAWVSERKDVLSGVFFMLTLRAYLRYIRQPGSLARYAAVAMFFTLGLMAKPMLVTLPFVLLLLDYWPLHRFAPAPGNTAPAPWLEKLPVPARLALEKIPLLLLSAASCIPTILTEQNGIRSEDSYRLPLRIANALTSYVIQIGRTFWPAKLAAFYPYPTDGLPLTEVSLAALLLAGISLAAFLARRKYPYLLVGWLWYLGMLVPVIGLVQVGLQAQADRHTYLPQIGLALLLTWLVTELTGAWRGRRWILGVGALAVLASLAIYAAQLTAVWRNSETLWTHAAACTSRNFAAENNLGSFYFLKNDIAQAIPHFQKAAEYDSTAYRMLERCSSVEVLNDLAWFMATNPDAAARNGSQAIELAEHACELTHHQMPVCLGTLAAAYAEAGRFDEAIAAAQAACALAEKANAPKLLEKNRELLELYRAHQPYRDTPP